MNLCNEQFSENLQQVKSDFTTSSKQQVNLQQVMTSKWWATSNGQLVIL